MSRKKPKRPKPPSKSAPLPPAAKTETSPGATPPAAKKSVRYDAEEKKPPTKPLTVREEQVVALVAKGKENVEIAKDLGTGERNIEKHMKNIREKIRAKTRTAVVSWWYERKIEQLLLRFEEGK